MCPQQPSDCNQAELPEPLVGGPPAGIYVLRGTLATTTPLLFPLPLPLPLLYCGKSTLLRLLMLLTLPYDALPLPLPLPLESCLDEPVEQLVHIYIAVDCVDVVLAEWRRRARRGTGAQRG